MKTYLNTSFDKIDEAAKMKSFSDIYQINKRSSIKKWFYGILVISLVILLLPWTQNIRSNGNITTLRQEDRPQEINTIIPGRVVKWFVKEGDFVKKGDTILQLGEVKVEYFDPILLQRTQRQIDAKNQSILAYEGKASTSVTQTEVLRNAMELKLNSVDNKIGQQKLKITSDSADLAAANNALNAYTRQIAAAKVMLDSGVISLIEFEKRRVTYQDAIAKTTSSGNKLNQSKQELLNLRIERNGVVQEYLDKIAKAEGDRFGSISAAASTEAEVLKLENTLANYDARQQLFFITAPQSGQITKAMKAGIGEMVKEGDMIVEIVPQNTKLAVEMFVSPLDLPLINKGQKVTFIFDGFPAIVFSGWPQTSYGTFSGIITAVETSVSPNGKFRVLVAEDKDDRPWPKNLRMGGGSKGIALLKDVPIIYELWRNINGFPPEFYVPETKATTTKK
ncbi:HlyD family secretion protein [Lacihabitans soyangensis]|uniref:HlyD family efflux transporter periplasmic adaptor subunit n=1 Tax=Lacihabitans soyangensis TaxID=869394 RepID=A0AAE3H606_9BACT|nr:HlyD family efflux transporter periplasmic adaptor subunit [Lacihabitans soyangensis]MCP9765393.1 HlyD family efflux transporter periplasmic adaptor subunit [Lacihabitans soyangensis]